MPSPFPGMDPYLESPHVWPDVHHALATEIRNALNRSLPAPYYAQMELRPELGIVEEDESDFTQPARRIVPDVMVVKHPRPFAEPGGVAVAEPETARATLSAAIEFAALVDEPARHHFVEIRDPTRGHKLVTLIEILSPTNKRPGPDRTLYATKQRAVLDTDASLVEIDLLRNGRHVLPTPELEAAVALIQPRPDYLVFVSRAWRRHDRMLGYLAYPARLREPLPCVGIPLKAELAEVPLDLQDVFRRVYDGGPYRRGAVRYDQPPDPPLSEEDAAWAEALLRAATAR